MFAKIPHLFLNEYLHQSRLAQSRQPCRALAVRGQLLRQPAASPRCRKSISSNRMACHDLPRLEQEMVGFGWLENALSLHTAMRKP
jgi:hypothetical protein